LFDNRWEYSDFVRTNLRPRRLLDTLAKQNKKRVPEAHTKIPSPLVWSPVGAVAWPTCLPPLHSQKEIKGNGEETKRKSQARPLSEPHQKKLGDHPLHDSNPGVFSVAVFLSRRLWPIREEEKAYKYKLHAWCIQKWKKYAWFNKLITSIYKETYQTIYFIHFPCVLYILYIHSYIWILIFVILFFLWQPTFLCSKKLMKSYVVLLTTNSFVQKI
jgi:hypothetical protein